MLGLGSNLSKVGLSTPGIVTDNLVLKHNYNAGAVVPVSDGAASFDSTNDYISVSETTLSVHDTAYSFAFWVNLKDTGWHPIFGDDDAFYNTIAIDDDNDRIIIEGSSDGDNMQWNTLQDPLVLGAWNHFAICLDGSGSAKAYQNGVELTMTADTIGSDLIFKYIGKGSSYFLGGYLCNVAYWSSQLTQSQIKSIMNKNYAGLTDSEKTNLVSWWNLDVGYDENYHSGTLYGTVLDNHHGGSTSSFGAEKVTNGDFSNGTTGWFKQNDSTVSYSVVNTGLELSISSTDDTGEYGHVTTQVDLVVGTTYKIELDIVQVVNSTDDGINYIRLGASNVQYDNGSGQSDIYYGNGSGGGDSQYRTLDIGTNVFYYKHSGDGTYLVIGARNDVTSLIIDNVSVKEVLGNTGQTL